MDASPLHSPKRDAQPLLLGSLVIMALFGAGVSFLPFLWIQPTIGIALGLCNIVAFLLMLDRSREPGPEQKGWRLMALSLIGVMLANGVLVLTPSTLTRVFAGEALFFGLQLLLALVQAAAILSWPFRSAARKSHLAINTLGSLLFGGSLFLVLWMLALSPVLNRGEWPIFFRMLGLSIRISFIGGVAAYILAADPRRVRGPMGWIFSAVAGITALVALARPYLYSPQGVMQPTPL